MRTDRPLTLSVTEAGNLLGVSRSTAYELVRSGELESIRLRRRLVVPVAAIVKRLGMTLDDFAAIIDEPFEVQAARPPLHVCSECAPRHRRALGPHPASIDSLR